MEVIFAADFKARTCHKTEIQTEKKLIFSM